jgi:hypothetical protein
MDVTRQQLTNYAEPNETGQGPPNRFINLRTFPDPKIRIVVRPNADALHSSAWLDLKAEPIVLSVPVTDHYFMLPMLSMWTDVFAVPGTRTTGPNSARMFLVTGPGWTGNVPAEMEVIKSPTRYVWFIGRTQTNGKADYVAPKGTVDPSIDMKTPPPVQVDKMDVATFFARFAEVLKDNPPSEDDHPTVHPPSTRGRSKRSPWVSRRGDASGASTRCRPGRSGRCRDGLRPSSCRHRPYTPRGDTGRWWPASAKNPHGSTLAPAPDLK